MYTLFAIGVHRDQTLVHLSPPIVSYDPHNSQLCLPLGIGVLVTLVSL